MRSAHMATHPGTFHKRLCRKHKIKNTFYNLFSSQSNSRKTFPALCTTCIRRLWNRLWAVHGRVFWGWDHPHLKSPFYHPPLHLLHRTVASPLFCIILFHTFVIIFKVLVWRRETGQTGEPNPSFLSQRHCGRWSQADCEWSCQRRWCVKRKAGSVFLQFMVYIESGVSRP